MELMEEDGIQTQEMGGYCEFPFGHFDLDLRGGEIWEGTLSHNIAKGAHFPLIINTVLFCKFHCKTPLS